MTVSTGYAGADPQDLNHFAGRPLERIRLDQHTVEIQLTEQLPQHRPLVVLHGGVAGLTVDVRLLRSSTPRPVSRCRA